MEYRVLAVGDVVGEPGLRHLERHLRPLQRHLLPASSTRSTLRCHLLLKRHRIL